MVAHGFQSTSLVRGTTFIGCSTLKNFVISIHVPRARDDTAAAMLAGANDYFNPRPSCEGRRYDVRQARFSERHFNPRPSCEGRLFVSFRKPTLPRYFNPRPSCEGRRVDVGFVAVRDVFQSTSLVRGTTPPPIPPWPPVFISIHVPRARDDERDRPIRKACFISIHVPRARDDRRRVSYKLGARNFNPRPSCEGRRRKFSAVLYPLGISIHVPRARDDTQTAGQAGGNLNFNPRPSCEGRPRNQAR